MENAITKDDVHLLRGILKTGWATPEQKANGEKDRILNSLKAKGLLTEDAGFTPLAKNILNFRSLNLCMDWLKSNRS